MTWKQGLSTAAVLLAVGVFSTWPAGAKQVSSDEVLDKVNLETKRSLEKLLTKAPDAARPAIEKAMASVSMGYDEALAHLTQVPSMPFQPERPSGPTKAKDTDMPEKGERSPESQGAEPVDGLERAAQAVEEGTTKALEILEGLPETMPEQTITGLNRTMRTIRSGRDRALATLVDTPTKPEFPEAAGRRLDRSSMPQRPERPERP